MVHFSIAALHAVSPRFATTEAWRMWAHDEAAAHELPEVPPDVSFLPPLQRRRLGTAARLVFAAAHPLSEAAKQCPTVFTSHDGEMNRSFQMLLQLFGQNEVSPTAFGLSVHNALAGQFSMLHHNTAENTAISADEAGWENGIIEACALLEEGAPQVLLIATDEPLHAEYTVQAERAPFAYAVAALLERGDDWQLDRLPESPAAAPEKHYWGALSWLRHYHRGDAAWQQTYTQESWSWQKKR
ncbi:MAG: beta-ketoacyl synthase chain length factor [Neisseria sp.]|nr:beta-ketoacyl synthase chain length factor [Neisseria sp.]